MKTNRRKWLGLAVAAAVLTLGGCSTMKDMVGGSGGGSQTVTLSGANEVPPVQTGASGTGTVSVAADGAVNVKVTVTGMTPTAAHIHQGAAGANGPVIVPLDKSGDNTFTSKPGAKLNADQLAAYKAGNTYLNVHSARNPGGEVRAQLKGQ